jgi:hypothetical protein
MAQPQGMKSYADGDMIYIAELLIDRRRNKRIAWSVMPTASRFADSRLASCYVPLKIRKRAKADFANKGV